MNGDINFEFKVKTCLEPDDIERLRKAAASDDDGAKFEVLNEIFSEDPNIWEAYYEAALDAYEKRSK